MVVFGGIYFESWIKKLVFALLYILKTKISTKKLTPLKRRVISRISNSVSELEL